MVVVKMVAIWLVSVCLCVAINLPSQQALINDFAKEYLFQHGYSDCAPPFDKLDVCSSESLQAALMKFQNNFKLKTTGYLDEETVEKMNVKRCDNMDFLESHPHSTNFRRKRESPNRNGLRLDLEEGQCLDNLECLHPLEVAIEMKKRGDISPRLLESRSFGATRSKRSLERRKTILWSFGNETLTTLRHRVAVMYAHKAWSEVLPLKFYVTRRNEAADVEYSIKKGEFKSYVSRNGRKTEIHVTIAANESLEDILIHSLGHYLGLPHIMDSQSVMYPLYENMYLEIGRQEQQLAQALHGKCSGRFDLVTNWLLNNASEYVTIFTRGNYCWVYSHALTRTLRGAENFCFFPPAVTAALQYFKADGSLESFAFEGSTYYKYDHAMVKLGYPRGLNDFSCHSREGPKQVDAAFSDSIFVYLFYEREVWLYDKENFTSRACPLHIVPLSDIFYPSTPTDSLDGPLDSIFRSYFFNAILIFRGDEMFAVTNRHLSVPNKLPRYEIKRIGPWNDVYDNICEDE